MNHKTDVMALNVLLTSKNAQQIFRDYDIVADCSDNVATRFPTIFIPIPNDQISTNNR